MKKTDKMINSYTKKVTENQNIYIYGAVCSNNFGIYSTWNLNNYS